MTSRTVCGEGDASNKGNSYLGQWEPRPDAPLKAVSRSAKELDVEIEGEDVSLAQILHHELLKDEDVVFSGVHPPHPLLKTVHIRVQTAKGHPKEALVSSGKAAAENAKDILEELNKSLRQR